MKMEPSTPRRSSRRNSFSSRSSNHSKESKNPYSTSGLDKFSALLAELEEKKQKIYSKVNPDEISLVRFVYKDSDDCVPIVVKIKNQDKQQQQKKINIKQNPQRNEDSDHQMMDKFPVESSNSAPENKQVKRSDDNNNNNNKMKIKRSWSWSWSFSFSSSDFMKLSNWRRPSYYLPAVIVLILLFLVFFGRSFAILCTSIGWYIVPTLKSKAVAAESNPNVIKRSMKKKEYVRIYSDNKMVTTTAPKTATNNHSGNLKKHCHQKSW